MLEISAEDKVLLLNDPVAFRDLILKREQRVTNLDNLATVLPSNTKGTTIDYMADNAETIIKALLPFTDLMTVPRIKKVEKVIQEAPAAQSGRYNLNYRDFSNTTGKTFKVSRNSVFKDSTVTIFSAQHFMSRHHKKPMGPIAAQMFINHVIDAFNKGSIVVTGQNKRVVEYLAYKGFITK